MSAGAGVLASRAPRELYRIFPMAQTNPPKPLITPEMRVEEQQDRFQSSFTSSRLFFEENRTVVIGAVIGVVVLIAAVSTFMWWRASQDAQAEQALGTILATYEAGDLETALNGTEDRMGLLEIADQYGSATAAPFFAADALFQLGRYDEAEGYFDMVDDNGLIGASAIAGRAAIAEAQGAHSDAADLYSRAASRFESEATTPGYLLDAGRAHQAAGDMDAARGVYQTILDEYGDTPEALTASVEIASVQAALAPIGEATGDVEPGPAPDSTAGASGATPDAAQQAAMQEALEQALGQQAPAQ